MGSCFKVSCSEIPPTSSKLPMRRRAWYPSGPWIDGIRPPEPYAEPSPKQADPLKFDILEAEQVANFLVLKIKYPNCTNYEGQKVLVFKDTTALDLLKQKLIDPHFFEDKKYKCPIARFVPTKEGWDMAIRFARSEVGR